MLSINSQTLINTKRDRTAPDIVLFGEYGGSYAYGSKVTLPSAAAGDVLDPNVRFTLSVTDPDGKPCVATDGTEIKGVAPGRFEIELSAKGAYRVVYEAADTFGGRTASVTFLITSADTKPPVLQFGAEWITAAKINENTYSRKSRQPTISAAQPCIFRYLRPREKRRRCRQERIP